MLAGRAVSWDEREPVSEALRVENGAGTHSGNEEAGS